MAAPAPPDAPADPLWALWEQGREAAGRAAGQAAEAYREACRGVAPVAAGVRAQAREAWERSCTGEWLPAHWRAGARAAWAVAKREAWSAAESPAVCLALGGASACLAAGLAVAVWRNSELGHQLNRRDKEVSDLLQHLARVNGGERLGGGMRKDPLPLLRRQEGFGMDVMVWDS